MITVRRDPEGTLLTFDNVKTVRALLGRLGETCTTALVIRGRELLTEDRSLSPGDEITVRTVRSKG